MLTGNNLCKTYGSKTVLHNVSAKIEPGRITVTLGPSGSGKTTLLRALAMLEPPDAGIISIDNQCYEYPCSRRQHQPKPWPHITAVFQQLFLWPHLTLRANINLPLQKRHNCTQLMRQCEDLIDQFQMREFIDRYPNQVSLGQKQRAAMVRALALEPSYLLLDEITSALDVEQSAVILSHLESLKERGIGIFFITHSVHFARRVADSILFLENGEVIAQGGSTIITAPEHPRVARFLSAFDVAA